MPATPPPNGMPRIASNVFYDDPAAALEDMFWGDRTYMAEDPEGHRWTFATQVREVAPEDMKPPA